MRPIVEFCVANEYHGTEEIKRKLESIATIDVIEYGCLGNCGECYLSPYALVNGESVVAETPERLLEEIMKKIAEIEALDESIHDVD